MSGAFVVCRVYPETMQLEYFVEILRACDKVAKKNGNQSLVRNGKDGCHEILEAPKAKP